MKGEAARGEMREVSAVVGGETVRVRGLSYDYTGMHYNTNMR